MSTTLRPAPWLLDETELARVIQRRMPDVVEVRRQPSDYGSTAHLEDIEARASDGRIQALVFKAHRAPATVTSGAVRPSFVTDPLREVAVYRSILDPQAVASPTLFGTGVDAAGGWGWLLLERVRGRPLWQHGDPGVWCDAARWLAGHHERFLTDEVRLPAEARLLLMDREHHASWLERARELAAAEAEATGVLGDLATRYRPVLDTLDAMPRTFVHGELFPSNVMVRDTERRELATCPIDWESAAVGPCLLDLAALTSGRWEPTTRSLVTEAYRVRANELGFCDTDPAGFRQALSAARVQLAVVQLGWSADWSPPPEHRHDWLGDVAAWLAGSAA